MDASLDFYKNPDGTPSHFVTEILKFSECPVLLAPLEEYEINQIDFFYDSTASSVFAIKQFDPFSICCCRLAARTGSKEYYNEKALEMAYEFVSHFMVLIEEGFKGNDFKHVPFA